MNYNYLYSINKYHHFNFNNVVFGPLFPPTFMKSRKNLSIILINNFFKDLFENKIDIYSYAKKINNDDNNSFIILHKFGNLSRKISIIYDRNADKNHTFSIQLPIWQREFKDAFDFEIELDLHLNLFKTIFEIKENNDIFMAKIINETEIEISFNEQISKLPLKFGFKIESLFSNDEIITRFEQIFYSMTKNHFFTTYI